MSPASALAHMWTKPSEVHAEARLNIQEIYWGKHWWRKKLLRDLQEAERASDINVVLTAVKESRKKARKHPTSSHILSLPLPMHIISWEPDHFLFNLVSVNRSSHIHTRTFIFSSGTFTLGHSSNSWLGFGETLHSLHCSRGRTNQGVCNTVK